MAPFSITIGKTSNTIAQVTISNYQATQPYTLTVDSSYSNIMTPGPYVVSNMLLTNYVSNNDDSSQDDTHPFTIKGRMAGTYTQGRDTFSITIVYNFVPDPTAKANNVPTTKYLVDWLFHVGAIYMIMNNVSHSVLFGGTWTQIENRFLLYSTYSSKATLQRTTPSPPTRC